MRPHEDLRVLRANVDVPLPGQLPKGAAPGWPLLLCGLVALCAVAAITLLGSRPTPPPQPVTVSVAQSEPGGSPIVHDCYAVDDRYCLTANPTLHAALDKLATTSQGPALMQAAARAGVALRVATLGNDIYAVFDARSRQVTIDTSLEKMSARGQAAIVAHELRSVATWASPAGILPHTGLTCMQEEASAFAAEIAVWKELRGAGPPADALETEEDDIAKRLDTRGPGFWVDEAMKYRADCG